MFDSPSSGFQPDVLNRKEGAKIIAAVSFTCVFLILFLFEPFGEVRHDFELTGVIRILSYALVSSTVFLCCQGYLLDKLQRGLISPNKVSTRIAFWFAWYGFLFLAIASSMFLVKNLWMDFTVFSWSEWGVVVYRVLSISLLPLLVLVALSYRKSSSGAPSRELTIKSLDKNPEYLRLALSDLVSIKSDDNYITVTYLDNGCVRNRLLRNKLTNLELQLPPPLLRVHRSCMINLVNVESVQLNSQGGTVHMKASREAIRISRRSLDRFTQEWERYCLRAD